VVPTVTFRLLFVFVILAHERRRIVHVAITPDRRLDEAATAQPFPENQWPSHLAP